MDEPNSSSPRDPPELNSAPELTGVPEHLVRGSRSVAMDRALGERVISQIHERGSLMLELSRRWEEFEKEIDLKELALSKKILELEKKEERLKLVEEREKKIELLEVSITKRLTEKQEEYDLKQFLVTDVMRLVLEMQNEDVCTQLKGKEKLLGLVHDSMVKKHGELVKELQARKKEIRLLSKSIDDKSRELEMAMKEFDVKQNAETERMKKEAELMEISHKQLEAREKELRLLNDMINEKLKELRLLNEMINEKSNELEKKEESFQLKQEAEARKIEVKEKELEEKEKELEVKQREFEERLIQVETQNAETERMKKEAELMAISHKQLEAREKELRLLNETINEKSIELEKKEESFQLKQKAQAREIEVKEKRLEEKEKELELKQIEFEERLIQVETRKRSRRELRSSLLGEKGRDNGLIRPGKKHKPIREHKHVGETSSDFEYEDTSEAIVCIDPEPFSCPEPDFNDFSNTMSSFAVGQVWALYDPIDDMPRYYARIKRVLKQQLSLRVTWLESIQNTENEKLIPIACGRFKYGNAETNGHLMFSHPMHHIVHGKSITINPRKGETWALFRDWNKTWTSHREQHKPPYSYDLVEVITEFDSDQGIGVAYLKRVEGFTAVYEHGEQHGVIKTMISCDKMLSFSHRVPSYKLIGDEEEGIPNGWFELDPAAIPQACLNDYALVLSLRTKSHVFVHSS